MKRKGKKRSRRVNTPDSLDDQADIINLLKLIKDGDETDSIVEFRPRTSSSENAWSYVDEGHLFNAERNNYRTVTARIIRERDEVYVGGESIRMEDARKIVRLVHRARKNKKKYEFEENSDEFYTTYDVKISPSGDVSVGCKDFSYNEIAEFERRFLRKRS